MQKVFHHNLIIQYTPDDTDFSFDRNVGCISIAFMDIFIGQTNKIQDNYISQLFSVAKKEGRYDMANLLWMLLNAGIPFDIKFYPGGVNKDDDVIETYAYLFLPFYRDLIDAGYLRINHA